MSAHSVDALAASIYDRLIELDITNDLDNEQIWQAAHTAAQTIESSGTIKAIIRVWLKSVGMSDELLASQSESWDSEGYQLDASLTAKWALAIREVQS